MGRTERSTSQRITDFCECCEKENERRADQDSVFLTDRNGNMFCPDCMESLRAEGQRLIDALPKRIALCPQCAPEFYYPLQDGEGLSCPSSGCNFNMVVYERES